MKNKSIYKIYLKILLTISLITLILTLIPMIVLGFFAHPLGDDFYYGLPAMEAIRNGKNIFGIFSAALSGTINQYKIWQGTYSAMFLMHLPPQIFGDIFYRLYPAFIICLFAGSIFYVLKPFMHVENKDNLIPYISTSSLISAICIQFVPLCGETFYWFNGSFYYTGFLALTLFFFGFIVRYRRSHKKIFLILSIIGGFFIAGGNYASLLPAILITGLTLLNDIITLSKNKKSDRNPVLLISDALILFSLLCGLTISVLAPGNALRQATSYGTTPVKAVIKSILQCINYTVHWTPAIVFAVLIILTPAFINIVKSSTFDFKYPYLVCPVIFGVYCSCECPTFYAQNNGGAARVFDICFYMMLFTVFFIYFYILGAVVKHFENKNTGHAKKYIICIAGVVIICLIVSVLRPLNETFPKPNSSTAFAELVNGDAAYYDKQYSKRAAIIASNPGGDVTVPLIDVPENLKYFINCGDISTDSSANHFIAAYYGLNSITAYSQSN
ncbi:MAG: hypothetical protein K5669_10565 [Lachnospiraceae bacterium]|nr:hypothetical protein [Lachnospiraceae bacterium]